MRATVRDAYGSVDVLRLGEIDPPVAGDGEVLVRVVAAGVDQGVGYSSRKRCGKPCAR
jgi:NADPH:quinone reductase-like Zn-dependent oxidoreductase